MAEVFIVEALYFTRMNALGTLWPSGQFTESGGNWKCGACMMVLARGETPQQHAALAHPKREVEEE